MNTIKSIFIVALLFLVTFTAFAEHEAMLNVQKYSAYFLNEVGRIADKYVIAASSEKDIERIASLAGRDDDIDTALEIALLSNAAGVVNIRPVEASKMLGNAKQAGLKLGAATYKELVELKFLDPKNTAAIGKYETMLKFIQDKHGLSRADIEKYFRDGVRGFVAEIVNEEFNKISFMIDRKYNAVLTRNPQNGHYTLSYERPSVQNSKKELSAPTLQALSSAMSKNPDFNRTTIDSVRAQAGLIPAVVYADWQKKGVAGGVDALDLVIEVVTNFYLNPNKDTYNALPGIYARYRTLTSGATARPDAFATEAISVYERTIRTFNPELQRKVSQEGERINTYVKSPNDPRYDIFSTRYSVGGE